MTMKVRVKVAVEVRVEAAVEVKVKVKTKVEVKVKVKAAKKIQLMKKLSHQRKYQKVCCHYAEPVLLLTSQAPTAMTMN